MSEPRTVTLATLDHGDVTVPEPGWCVGHPGVPGDRVDIIHCGLEIALTFRGQHVADAGLVQSPFTPSPAPGISVSLLGQTLDPQGVYELAAALDRFTDQLRALADQLDNIRKGEPRA